MSTRKTKKANSTAKQTAKETAKENIVEKEAKLAEQLAKLTIATKNRDVELIEAKILEFYDQGWDKRDGKLTQSLECQIDGEDSIRNYAIKGFKAINKILGDFDEKTELFEKVTYKDNNPDLPISLKVPDVDSRDGTYWFQL